MKTNNLSFLLNGMHCKSCIKLVEATLSEIPGVKVTDSNFNNKTVGISYNPNITTPEILINSIKEIGYKAEII
jgi:Cu+-exporting ATPase